MARRAMLVPLTSAARRPSTKPRSPGASARPRARAEPGARTTCAATSCLSADTATAVLPPPRCAAAAVCPAVGTAWQSFCAAARRARSDATPAMRLPSRPSRTATRHSSRLLALVIAARSSWARTIGCLAGMVTTPSVTPPTCTTTWSSGPETLTSGRSSLTSTTSQPLSARRCTAVFPAACGS